MKPMHVAVKLTLFLEFSLQDDNFYRQFFLWRAVWEKHDGTHHCHDPIAVIILLFFAITLLSQLHCLHEPNAFMTQEATRK
jgi:hypothetical protein